MHDTARGVSLLGLAIVIHSGMVEERRQDNKALTLYMCMRLGWTIHWLILVSWCCERYSPTKTKKKWKMGQDKYWNASTNPAVTSYLFLSIQNRINCRQQNRAKKEIVERTVGCFKRGVSISLSFLYWIQLNWKCDLAPNGCSYALEH